MKMRVLNRVLTWRPSEAGRAEVITFKGDPQGARVVWTGRAGGDGALAQALVLGKLTKPEASRADA